MYITLSFFIFIFGLCIGSFLNCLIWRLYKEESIMGRSYCPHCRHQLAWYDNIPVLSFILLGGKCRYCGKRISWQYPAVELATGLLFLLAAFLNYGSGIIDYGGDLNSIIYEPLFIVHIFRDFFFISVLTIIFIIDLRWYLILDVVTIPAIILILLFNLILGMDWQDLAISGIIGAGFFLLQYVISKGKWIGGGDIRMGLLMGFALGWPNILVALMCAYVIGAITGVILILAGKKEMGSKLPFGVFLSIGTLIALFWGDQLVRWYLNIQ